MFWFSHWHVNVAFDISVVMCFLPDISRVFSFPDDSCIAKTWSFIAGSVVCCRMMNRGPVATVCDDQWLQGFNEQNCGQTLAAVALCNNKVALCRMLPLVD
jgi:hypothetical protein